MAAVVKKGHAIIGFALAAVIGVAGVLSQHDCDGAREGARGKPATVPDPAGRGAEGDP